MAKLAANPPGSDSDDTPIRLARIVVVIVTYNRIDLLKKAVANTLAENPVAVVVVDNDSSDGTDDWLRALSERDPRVDPVFTGANLGGAGGFHHGVNWAMEKYAPDWILLHDDDSWPHRGCLKIFESVLKATPDRVGVLVGAVENTEGEICEMNRPRRNPFRSRIGLFKWVLGLEASDIEDERYAVGSMPTEVDMATFVGFFVRGEVVSQVGAPRKELFIYGDDYIYTLSIRAAGFDVLFDPRLRFSHDNFATRGGRKIFEPPWRMYYSTRNSVEAWRIGVGPLWRLMAKLRTRQWVRDAEYQPNPEAYLHFMKLGLEDGLDDNFSRSLPEVIASWPLTQ